MSQQRGHMAHVYWLHLKGQSLDDGYIGVTTMPLSKRIYFHKWRGENPHLESAFNKYGDDIIQSILLEGPKEYCYEIEAKLRPNKNIGWNIAEGGSAPPSLKGKPPNNTFKKGYTPWNKGKKCPQLKTSGTFQKGHTYHPRHKEYV
jgi:hypothetical protein